MTRPRVALLVASFFLVAASSSISAVRHSAERTGRIGSAGVSVSLPSTWRSIRFVDPPRGTANHDPLTRIVAASAPIWFGRGCNDLDYVFPRTGVAIVVVEWVSPTPSARWSPRPRRFTAKNLPVHSPPALECFDGPGGGIQFAERGRRFAAYLLLGRRAEMRLAARARAVLDTLRVGARRS